MSETLTWDKLKPHSGFFSSLPCNLHMLVEFSLPGDISATRKAFTSFSASSFDSEAIHGRDLVLPKSLLPTAETIAVEMLILVHCPAELQNVSGFF